MRQTDNKLQVVKQLKKSDFSTVQPLSLNRSNWHCKGFPYGRRLDVNVKAPITLHKNCVQQLLVSRPQFFL